MKNRIFHAAVVILTFVAAAAAQEADLTKIAREFGSAFQAADERKMDAMLTDDFRYYTNVPCSYRNCDQGAEKADYVKGVVDERREHSFKVISILMKPIDPLINTQIDISSDAHATFVCVLVTKADRKLYNFQSVIDYYFRKDQDGSWKISKIENRILH